MYPNCLCGSNNYKTTNLVFQDKKFSIIQCRNCGLARTWPKPLLAEEPTLYYNNQNDYLQRFEQLDLWKKFVARSIRNIKKVRTEGRLLDIGCNLGIFVKQALAQGYDAFGCDLSAMAVNFGREKLGLENRIFPGALADAVAKNEKYNIVVYSHVLEHIENITEELSLAKKVLKPQGLIVIEVPNYKSLWRVVTGGRWYGYSPAQHIWQFSRKPLEKILKQQGYTIVYASTRLSLYHELTFNLEGAVKLLAYFISYIFNIGDSLLIIARKNET